MKRRNGHQHNDRGTIRIRNNSFVLFNIVRINFRNHERNFRMHAKGACIVNHDGARFDRMRNKPLADRATCAGQHKIDTLKSGFLKEEFLNLNFFAAAFNSLPFRTNGSKQAKFGYWKFPFG